MGDLVTIDFSAFNYGYVSPRLRGRVDLDFYDQSMDFMLNYLVTPQGEASYRTGSIYVSQTKGNNPARLIPFLYNTEQAYILEFTDEFIRFYKDHGLVTQTPVAITAITKATNAQLTIPSHGLSPGDPIFLADISGMHQLNGQEAQVVTAPDANTITININTTTYSTYVSGGTAAKIVQIASPYQEAELFELDYTQTNDTMYIAHRSHQPRKLTRGGSHTSWALNTFTFNGNPFGTTKAASQAITAITQANPAKITYSGSDTYADGDTVALSGIVGMTQMNGKNVTVTNVNTGANTFDAQGVDSTAFTAYSSAGIVEEYTAFSWPSLVTLYEGRLIYAASDAFPTRMWFSKAGALDDFTYGTADGDAIQYNLRADQANRIRWIVGAENYMAIGTSGSEYRVSGGGENDTITPTNISIKPSSFNGVATTRPIRLDSYILFVQRNGRTVRSFEYNALKDGYTSPDRTLLADHIGKSKIKQMSYTAGTPNIIWSIRNDGRMIGLTFDPEQQVIAWHQHNTQGKYTSIATIPEANDDDELWQVVERTVGGVTKRFVEYTPNVPDIPIEEEFFTGIDNQEADLDLFLTSMWNVQKTLLHADSALVYDGRDVANVDLTITGDLEAGSSVTVTASGAYFTSQMATDRRRIQSPYGGQIEIQGFASSTVVTGVVLYDLEDDFFEAFDWYWMAIGVGGIWHLEGQAVSVLADGGVIANKTVSAGQIILDEHAGYVIVGLSYNGIGKTQGLEGGSRNGRAQTKPRVVTKLGVRLRASIGTKFGTSLYKVEEPAYRETEEVSGRPPRLINGTIPVQITDGWNEDKNLYWLHDTPTPSNIQYIMATMETNDG